MVQETLFKENPEDTKSIEFVDTHTINCNDSMTPSRVKSQEHLQQDTHDCLTKDQAKFYTHEISPQNIHKRKYALAQPFTHTQTHTHTHTYEIEWVVA